MPSKNTNRKRSHLQPVPNDEPVQLAHNEATWRRLDDRIERAVNAICGNGDFDAADGLLLIVDLVANPEFDRVSREGVWYSIQKYAFRFTRDHDQALDGYLDRLNPLRKRRAS